MKTASITALLAALAAAILSGCAGSTKSAEARGFLGDYSELQEGGKGEARFYYINESTDFTRFTKIQLLPITVWQTEDSNISKLDTDEIQGLVDYLFTAVHGALLEDYLIVDKPGPDVLTIRIAITEAVGANQALNTVSTVVPVGLVASTGKKLATGSHAFVGTAAIELEMLDSTTGERVAAVIDERAGGKGAGGTWAEVEKAFDYWADKLVDRLQRLRESSSLKQRMTM